jgi:hypothetical protein
MRDSKFALVAADIIKHPSCHRCGARTWLSSVEPTDDPNWDLRTFECPRCQQVQQVEVKFQ